LITVPDKIIGIGINGIIAVERKSLRQIRCCCDEAFWQDAGEPASMNGQAMDDARIIHILARSNGLLAPRLTLNSSKGWSYFISGI